jgi:outer membrane protein assembly factor BamB
VLSGKHVLCGMAGGKLLDLNVEDGAVLWDVSVSVPSGRSELERLADIDGDPLAQNGIIYVATYQGEVAALEESSGSLLWRRKFSSYSRMAADRYNVYASDADGSLWALDADNGSARWSQKDLHNRRLSAVALVSGTIAVGDFEGYVHFISPEDGSLIGRTRVGSKPITKGVLVAGDVLFVLGDGGELEALKLKPVK